MVGTRYSKAIYSSPRGFEQTLCRVFIYWIRIVGILESIARRGEGWILRINHFCILLLVLIDSFWEMIFLNNLEVLFFSFYFPSCLVCTVIFQVTRLCDLHIRIGFRLCHIKYSARLLQGYIFLFLRLDKIPNIRQILWRTLYSYYLFSLVSLIRFILIHLESGL